MNDDYTTTLTVSACLATLILLLAATLLYLAVIPLDCCPPTSSHRARGVTTKILGDSKSRITIGDQTFEGNESVKIYSRQTVKNGKVHTEQGVVTK